MNHERRQVDLAETMRPGLRFPDANAVVANAGDVVRAIELRAEERFAFFGVERVGGAGKDAEHGAAMCDDGSAIRRVEVIHARHRGQDLGRGRRQALDGFAVDHVDNRASRRRGHDGCEREYAIGVVETQELREHAAHRRADDVGLPDPVVIQHGRRVVRHRLQRVIRLTGRATGCSADVTVVVADDVASARREAFAKAVPPQQHGGTGTHDEQDCRVTGVADGVGADLDAVRGYERLGRSLHGGGRC